MIKRIPTPEWENAGAVLLPVLMKKHVENEKLRSSVADLQVLVATGEVAVFNIANVDDVIFDVFPEAGVIRHVEPPSGLFVVEDQEYHEGRFGTNGG